jgi:hypothetical protein
MKHKAGKKLWQHFSFIFESITLKTQRTKHEIHYSDTQSKLQCLISSNKGRKGIIQDKIEKKNVKTTQQNFPQ